MDGALDLYGLPLASLLTMGGVGCFVVAAAFRDQLWLRGFLILGSVHYIAYYFVASSDGPLWDAMLGSSLILGANLAGFAALAASRMTFSLPELQRRVLSMMGPVEPGLFRKLMRMGELRVAEDRLVLTREGEPPDALWFVFDAPILIAKGGAAEIEIPADCFIGEIGFLLGVPASATVSIGAGARYVRWDAAALRRKLRRDTRLEIAVNALIASDLARKVAASAPKPVARAEGD